MYVRRATPADTEAVHALTGDALARILTQVRASDDWLPAVTFVALDADGRIVGHVTGARGHVGTDPAVALVPPAVHPDHQGRCVGTALMHSVLGAADALGEPLAAITGIPTHYYARFGFRPAREHAITAPISDLRLGPVLPGPPAQRLHRLPARQVRLSRTIHRVMASRPNGDLGSRNLTEAIRDGP